MGESKPIASNKNAQGRQENRSVELRVIPLQS
jgi:outer membrane protein OmpA-like peptidoglycan-associated protein